MQKPAHTSYPIHDLLQQRWSPRALNDDPIDKETLTRLFEAARWAPSWKNDQPWRFIIATKQDHPDDFEALHGHLMPGNQQWAGNASAFVVVVAKRQYGHHEQPNPITYYDTGQAVAFLSIEALSHGLYIHQMGGIKRANITAMYNIPDDHVLVVVMAVARLGDAKVLNLSDDVVAKENAPRKRKDLSEIVFSGDWNSPADLG